MNSEVYVVSIAYYPGSPDMCSREKMVAATFSEAEKDDAYAFANYLDDFFSSGTGNHVLGQSTYRFDGCSVEKIPLDWNFEDAAKRLSEVPAWLKRRERSLCW